jgi:hypothetical protein
VVDGGCTGRAHRCKAKQGRRGKTALRCEAYYYNSTIFGRRPEAEEDLFGNCVSAVSLPRKEMIADVI